MLLVSWPSQIYAWAHSKKPTCPGQQPQRGHEPKVSEASTMQLNARHMKLNDGCGACWTRHLTLWSGWGNIIIGFRACDKPFPNPQKRSHQDKDTRQTTGRPSYSAFRQRRTRSQNSGPTTTTSTYTRTPTRNENFVFFFGNDAQNQRVFQLAASVGEQLSRQSHVDFDFGFVSFRFGLVSSPENISQSV